MFVRTEKK